MQNQEINDPKLQKYMHNVAQFAVNNLKRKGYTNEGIIKLMELPDFVERCMTAYNENFQRWASDPKTLETLTVKLYKEFRK
jgi:hypothetical protein